VVPLRSRVAEPVPDSRLPVGIAALDTKRFTRFLKS
jgi:hypothetical protein